MSHPVVTEARTWIGTRFAHQGRRRKTANDPGGVDCLGLLIGVAAALDLKDRHGRPLIHSDEMDYSKLPDGGRLCTRLSDLLFPIEPTTLHPGHIALFDIDSNPQHLGILSSYSFSPTGGEGWDEGERLQGRSLQSFNQLGLPANPPHPNLLPQWGRRNIGIIHAYAPSRKVVEHRLDEEWKRKIVKLFRVN